jgi:transcriptional regulator with XRE-family HTH domain
VEEKSMDVGKIIKALRLQENLTQQQLASKVYLKQNTISQYEKNERAISSDILVNIIDALGYKLTFEKKGDERMTNSFLFISKDEWKKAFPLFEGTPSFNNSSYDERLLYCYNCFERNVSINRIEDYSNEIYYELIEDEHKDIIVNAEVQIDEDEKVCYIDVLLKEDTTLEEFKKLMEYLRLKTTNCISESDYVEDDYYWRYDKF